MADAEAIAAEVEHRDLSVGVAESLTGGLLSNRLAEAPGAAQWLRGGLVAYSAEVKQQLLGVSPGPVVTERAALEMAVGAAQLLGAEVAVSVTGVGGPDPEEGQPAGTVWLGLCLRNRLHAKRLHLDGDPGEVCRRACDEALAFLLAQLRAS